MKAQAIQKCNRVCKRTLPVTASNTVTVTVQLISPDQGLSKEIGSEQIPKSTIAALGIPNPWKMPAEVTMVRIRAFASLRAIMLIVNPNLKSQQVNRDYLTKFGMQRL